MSELAKKLHLLKDGTIDDITAYTTLEEVNQQGIKVKFDGIDGYVGYGTEGELSRLKYQKQEDGQVYNVVKSASVTKQITATAYRNNDALLQELPAFIVNENNMVHFDNGNVPAISGYDFVCAVPNHFFAKDVNAVKLYYIPQSVADRTKTDWSNEYFGVNYPPSTPADLCNTYSATNMLGMFSFGTLYKMPKMNTTNVTNMKQMLTSNNATYLDLNDLDTYYVEDLSLFFQASRYQSVTGTLDLSNCRNVYNMFNQCKFQGLHLKNVPRSLDFSRSGGIEGETYIIDNYID